MDGKADRFAFMSGKSNIEKEFNSVSITIATHEAQVLKNESKSIAALPVRTAPQVVANQADLPTQSPPEARFLPTARLSRATTSDLNWTHTKCTEMIKTMHMDKLALKPNRSKAISKNQPPKDAMSKEC
jgi:hypothetical protein